MTSKDSHKPTRNDLLHDLEDIKSSLEREVFGDLGTEQGTEQSASEAQTLSPEEKQMRELQAKLEQEVFGDAAAQQDPNPASEPASEPAPEPASEPASEPAPEPAPPEPDIPTLTEITRDSGVVDLSEVEIEPSELPPEELEQHADDTGSLELDLARVLEEEHSEPENPAKATVTPAAEARSAKPEQSDKPADMGVLPGQQSLFDEPPAGGKKSEKKPPAAKKPAVKAQNTASPTDKPAENPFLPAHIRERLGKNQEQSVLADLAEVGHTLSKTELAAGSETAASGALAPGVKSARPVFNTTASVTRAEEELIDALVAKYLPEIEKELRRRLAEQIAKPADN